MKRLRKNITINDIKCNCGCGLDKISSSILDIVQDARDHFNKPAHINSGNHSACRCKIHNREVGGRENSMHLPDEDNGVCRAIDFHIEDVSIEALHKYLIDKYGNCLGIGIYSSFVHVDDRMKKAFRWDLRKK